MSDFEPITTQADLDRIVTARLNREVVKANEAADAAKVAHAAELEALKTAHATALTEATSASAAALAAAQGETAAERLVALRLTTAAAKGVPANLLTGSTAEELEAAADALLTFQKGGTSQGNADGLDNLLQMGDRDQEARLVFGL